MGTDLAGAVDVVHTTSYYPFGLVMSQMNGNTLPGYGKNKYLYNGKELQDDVFTGSSLNWYDYGARFYDPQIGRWNLDEPIIEKSRIRTLNRLFKLPNKIIPGENSGIFNSF